MEYCPKPADDLYALVCSLFIVFYEPRNIFFETDGKDDVAKISSFWKTCAGRIGWKRALQAAEACNYGNLKNILSEIFNFTPEWNSLEPDQQT